MKTTANKENSTPSQSSQPFFNKKGEGSFLSSTNEVEQPFFSPNPVFQKSPANSSFSVGNNATHTLFSIPNAIIQAKLTTNEPGDKYEQEADAMAEQVMRMSAPVSGGIVQTKPLNITTIHRKCTACEDEEKVQRLDLEEEEPIQTKSLMRKASEGGGYTTSPQLTSQLNSSKGGGNPLPKQTLGFMNQAFGTDFSKVRIHTGAQAVEMSQGIQAKAFTHGADIYFNKGQYSPQSSEGKRLLGHELTHVVQQMGHVSCQISRQPDTSQSPLTIPHEGVDMPWVGKGPGISSSDMGYLRNNQYFWTEFERMYPGRLSFGNQTLIGRGIAPVVDDLWISFYPQHAAYRGDTLEHHHVGQGSRSVPLPSRLHDAYTVFHPQRRVVGDPLRGTRPLPPQPTRTEAQAEIDRHVRAGRIRGTGVSTLSPPLAPQIPPASELAPVLNTSRITSAKTTFAKSMAGSTSDFLFDSVTDYVKEWYVERQKRRRWPALKAQIDAEVKDQSDLILRLQIKDPSKTVYAVVTFHEVIDEQTTDHGPEVGPITQSAWLGIEITQIQIRQDQINRTYENTETPKDIRLLLAYKMHHTYTTTSYPIVLPSYETLKAYANAHGLPSESLKPLSRRRIDDAIKDSNLGDKNGFIQLILKSYTGEYSQDDLIDYAEYRGGSIGGGNLLWKEMKRLVTANRKEVIDDAKMETIPLEEIRTSVSKGTVDIIDKPITDKMEEEIQQYNLYNTYINFGMLSRQEIAQFSEDLAQKTLPSEKTRQKWEERLKFLYRREKDIGSHDARTQEERLKEPNHPQPAWFELGKVRNEIYFLQRILRIRFSD